MRRGLVGRLEQAKRVTNPPYVQVIELDEYGHPTQPVAARPDGRPIPVIIMPALQTSPAVQIMATPEKLRQQSQH